MSFFRWKKGYVELRVKYTLPTFCSSWFFPFLVYQSLCLLHTLAVFGLPPEYTIFGIRTIHQWNSCSRQRKMCCLISCLTFSFNVCTTMLMSTSIISFNNVCSICLRALGNASLLMASIRVRKFLRTSPLFLIKCINQDSSICCFH